MAAPSDPHNRTNVPNQSTSRGRGVFDQAAVLRHLDSRDRDSILTLTQLRRGNQSDFVAGFEQGVFLVKRGAVRIYLIAAGGREVTLAHRRAGEFFELDEEAVPGSYIPLAEASADGTVIYHLPWENFLQHVVHSPHAAERLIRELRQELRLTRDLMGRAAFESISIRLGRTLADLAAMGDGRSVHQNQYQLAALIGARPNQVSKELSNFRSRGMVTSPPHARPIIINLQTFRRKGFTDLPE